MLSAKPLIFNIQKQNTLYIRFQMMKQPTGILILFILLFSITGINSAWACNDASAYHLANANSVKKEVDNCVQVFDDCTVTHPGEDCPPDTDGCGHCHCPGCGSVFNVLVVHIHFSPYVVYNPALLEVPQKQAFYFASHIPEGPYLPIWQPPQIKA